MYIHRLLKIIGGPFRGIKEHKGESNIGDEPL